MSEITRMDLLELKREFKTDIHELNLKMIELEHLIKQISIQIDYLYNRR